MDDTVDTETEVATDSSNVNNGKGSQETELDTLEACLIPKPITESKSVNIQTRPKKGEKFFIRSTRIEKEILLDISITMLDMHGTISMKALLDSGATGLFIN
jgi:hypothetical protein